MYLICCNPNDWNQYFCIAKSTAIQRWSPRGHILKSLALKVKSLALILKPQVLWNCPILGRGQHCFLKRRNIGCKTSEASWRPFFLIVEYCLKNIFEDLFCWRTPEKKFLRPFFVENAWILWEIYKGLEQRTFFFFFLDHFRIVSLVLSLGLDHSCPWPRKGLSSLGLFLDLALSLVSSTPPLLLYLNE